ncbi:SIR2 family protein [Paenibacillus caui]|uniref:SIR2 family protein n=1 Tax=Paenibacillus caui TaxID=2873927 RepID=UPI001CA92428|nr:SIR2 family protein [Paenibacillus caui]
MSIMIPGTQGQRIFWPESLVAEVAERRCIIILGAGASASSVAQNGQRPKDWKGFLFTGIDLMWDERAKQEARELVESSSYLDAAQVMRDHMYDGDFRDLILREFQHPRYQPSDIHKILLKIDPKIVITTNYDQIYDNYCLHGGAYESYNVCKYYESHALNDLRSNRRVILKAHGCVADPSRVVLTRSKYFEARNDYPSFFSILDALFLTHTLLFIGSGLNDPDINLLLENANIAAKSSMPHYALTPRGRHNSIKQVMKKTYNLELLEYEEGRHEQVITALKELEEAVISYRVHRGTGF